MSSKVVARLAELGITIPAAPAPVANYVPFVRSGNLLHISGQISKSGNDLLSGQVGEGAQPVAHAEAAAKASIINFISQLQAATNGNLDKVKKIVKINVFVSSIPTFDKQPVVANAASDLLVKAFGEDVGRHARSAVGVAALPLGVSVEIDGVVEVEDDVSKL